MEENKNLSNMDWDAILRKALTVSKIIGIIIGAILAVEAKQDLSETVANTAATKEATSKLAGSVSLPSANRPAISPPTSVQPPVQQYHKAPPVSKAP